MSEAPPLRPGMIVGILGGGQLGRMLAMAAAELGLSCHIYCPDPKSPAFAVAAARTVAPYDDESALAAFAGAVDLVTFEFENIPVDTVRFLEGRVAVLPGSGSLESAQDRLAEKRLISGLGIPVAPFAEVSKQADIYSALARTGRPGDPQDAAPRLRRQGPGADSRRRRSRRGLARGRRDRRDPRGAHPVRARGVGDHRPRP